MIPTIAENPEKYARHLRYFLSTIKLESHYLRFNPHLLFQQLFNRLQWEDQIELEILNEQQEQKFASNNPEWLKSNSPFPESEELLRTFSGHTDIVVDCAISADGKYLVSASSDIRVWEMESGSQHMILKGVSNCAMSPDGSLIITASEDNALIVYETASGRQINSLEGRDNFITDCQFSPEGSFVIIAGYDGKLEVWDPLRAQLMNSMDHGGYIASCSVSPDGRFVASAGKDSRIRVWQVKTGDLVCTLHDEEWRNPYSCCRWMPDGNSIVAVSDVPTPLLVWDFHSGELIAKPEHWDMPEVHGCAVSPDGKIVVTNKEESLVVWDTGDWTPKKFLQGHAVGIRSCAVSPDNKLLISAAEDGTLKIWDLQDTNRLISKEKRHLNYIESCLISHDGSYVAAKSLTGGIEVREMKEGKLRFHVKSKMGGAAFGESPMFSVSQDDSFLLFRNDHKSLVILEHKRGEIISTLSHPAHISECLILPPNGEKVVTGATDGNLRLWDSSSGEMVGMVPVLPVSDASAGAFVVRFVAASADGLVVVAAKGNKLAVWNLRTGTLQRLSVDLLPSEGVTDLSVGPDGCIWLQTTEQVLMRIADHPRGKWVVLESGTRSYPAYAVSPDGQFGVTVLGEDKGPGTAREEGELRVWRVPSGDQLFSLKGHRDAVVGCAISPDGSLIASVARDQSLRIWRLQDGAEVGQLPLMGQLTRVAFHPFEPLVVCSDASGNIYLVALEGFQYGPLIVTAVDLGQGPVVFCPRCRTEMAIENNRLGHLIQCSESSCGKQFEVNPFLGNLKIPSRESRGRM